MLVFLLNNKWYFPIAVQLVQIRGEAMQMASNLYDGGMATVICRADHKLNIAMSKAKEWCVDRGVDKPECSIANYLFPNCKVIAGSKEALRYIEENMDKYGIRKMKKIPAYGAFHTSLMESAVGPFAKALKSVQIEDPLISVHSNIDGKRYYNAEHIQKNLPKQVSQSLFWTFHLRNRVQRDNKLHIYLIFLYRLFD